MSLADAVASALIAIGVFVGVVWLLCGLLLALAARWTGRQ